jgi:hypothetical protein
MALRSNLESSAIPRRRYLSLIWALCTPGILALIVGIPMGYMDSAGIWRGHRDGMPMAFLERVGSGSILFTLILGPIATGIAVVLMILLLRSREKPRIWKIEAAIAVALSLLGMIWVLVLASHMWG